MPENFAKIVCSFVCKITLVHYLCFKCKGNLTVNPNLIFEPGQRC